MIDELFPTPGTATPDWAEPENPDLLHIAYASYRYSKLLDWLVDGGYRLRQVEEADIIGAQSDINDSVNAIVSEFQDAYNLLTE